MDPLDGRAGEARQLDILDRCPRLVAHAIIRALDEVRGAQRLRLLFGARLKVVRRRLEERLSGKVVGDDAASRDRSAHCARKYKPKKKQIRAITTEKRQQQAATALLQLCSGTHS